MSASHFLWVLFGSMLSASFLFALTSCAVEPANEDEAFTQARAAARIGDIRRLENLMKAWPALVNRKSRVGETLLFDAAAADNAPCVEFLIGRGAEVNWENGVLSALDWCAVMDARKAARVLVEKGGDVNLRPSYPGPGGKRIYSTSPMETAARWAHFELVELFFKHGAKVESHPTHEYNALHLACMGRRSGDFKSNPEFFENTKRMIPFLVEKGYDINGRTQFGNSTPLDIACSHGTLDIAEYLLTRTDVTDVNAINISDLTALDQVLKRKPSPQRERVVQALRAKGALTMDEIRLKQRQEEKKKRDASNQPVGCATFRWATAC